jgi:hypothetical protein
MAKTRHLSNKPRATKKRSQKKRSQRKRARTGKKRGGYDKDYSHPRYDEKTQNSLIYGVTEFGKVVFDIASPLIAGLAIYTVYMGAKDVIGMTGGKSSGIKGGAFTFDPVGFKEFLDNMEDENFDDYLRAGGELSEKLSEEQLRNLIQQIEAQLTPEQLKKLQKLLENSSPETQENFNSDIKVLNKNTL